MKLIEGRDIDLTAYPSDSTACILNETAVKAMGFKHPIGQVVTNGDTKFMVVGVVKDFIMEDPFQPIRPIVIEGPKYQWFNIIHIKLNPANSTHDNIEKVKKIFTQFNPDYPFEYKFVDEEYAQKFSDETTTATLAGLFAGLTIFISCLGLFGLAAYMAENRIKEIGVRKVLGASILGITTMLSIDFLWLVLISILIAAPIAWYSMDKWLGNYKYRMHMSLWIFVLAGLAAIVISLATVSYQAIKAALANPIKSLRTE
jgi:putative ABC transport system permease protein